MKISCPSCNAAYELDDSRVPPAGLSIKCPKCKSPFVVHRPKPGETNKIVQGKPPTGPIGAKPPTGPVAQKPPTGPIAGGPVPLPGQAGSAPPAGPPPGVSRPAPPRMAPVSAAAPGGGAVPLPGNASAPPASALPRSSAPVELDDDPFAEAAPPGAATQGAVPLPGGDGFELDDAPAPPRPPPPPASAAPPPPPDLDLDFPDAPEPVAPPPARAEPPAPPPARAVPPPPPAEEGMDFDFVEPPAPKPAARAAPPPDLDLLDFVDEKPAAKPAAPAAKTADKKRSAPPPPVLAAGGGADSSPAGGDGKGAREQEKDRKKAEREARKERDRTARARRKEGKSGAFAGGRGLRILGAVVGALALLAVVGLGVAAGRTPAGYFWLNRLVPARRHASATEVKVIEGGFQDLARGDFASARKATAAAAQLHAALPGDEDVSAFYVVAASELKLVYGQVGADWDQVTRLLPGLKGLTPAVQRARGAHALASGDAAGAAQLLQGVGGISTADVESLWLYALALSRSGDGQRAAALLDAALKGSGHDSEKLLLLRGDLALAKGQAAEGAASYERALAAHPASGRALIALADGKMRAGDTAGAGELLARALAPEQRKSLDAGQEGRGEMLRGRLAALARKPQEAETAFERAVALDPNSAEIREAYGSFRLARREYDKASRQFEAAIASGGSTPQILAGAARAHLGLNHLLEADKRIAEAVQKAPRDAHIAWLHGRVAEAIGRGEEALRDYERALQLEPNSAEALLSQGSMALARADAARAAEKLDAALKVPEEKRSVGEEEQLGELALLLGRKEVSRDAWMRALQKDPDDPLAHAGLGRALAALDDLPNARKELEIAVQAFDSDPVLLYDYGSLLRRMGDRTNALVALQKSVRLEGKEPRLRARLGALLVELGHADEAEIELRKATLQNDRLAEAQFFLGRALLDKKQVADAISRLQKAVEIDPDSAEYRYFLGLAFETGQQVREAAAAFEQARTRSPKDPEVNAHLGAMLLLENRFDDAVQAFRRATEVSPRKAKLWRQLGEAEQQGGLPDDAIRDLQKALALDEKTQGAWTMLGIAYKDKDCKLCGAKAIDAFRHAVEADPKDATAHHELGYLYKDAGRRKEAIAEFRKFLDLKPDSGDAAAVKDDIYYLQEETRRAP